MRGLVDPGGAVDAGVTSRIVKIGAVGRAWQTNRPSQVSYSKSTWSTPTSNEAVTVNFKQAIGASDALRTGAYTKTLTFTLSTTRPWAR